MLWLLTACVPAENLLPEDPLADGMDGTRGPHAVVLEHRVAPARVEERLSYDWVHPDPLEADAPVVVFVHGGLVDRTRYRWLATHLASRGYAVAAPAHTLDLAIFQSGNLTSVLDDIDHRDGRRRVAAAGHSLGGVIATWGWLDDDRIEDVALFASFPAGEGSLRHPGDVLSLSGTTDGSAAPEDVLAGAERFTAPFVGLVEGMNHYSWTDDATDAELDGDGPLTRPLEEVRQDALRVLDTWLDASLRDDPVAAERLQSPFPNVTP